MHLGNEGCQVLRQEAGSIMGKDQRILDHR
jgi:hypothetical protein